MISGACCCEITWSLMLSFSVYCVLQYSCLLCPSTMLRVCSLTCRSRHILDSLRVSESDGKAHLMHCSILAACCVLHICRSLCILLESACKERCCSAGFHCCHWRLHALMFCIVAGYKLHKQLPCLLPQRLPHQMLLLLFLVKSPLPFHPYPQTGKTKLSLLPPLPHPHLVSCPTPHTQSPCQWPRHKYGLLTMHPLSVNNQARHT